LQALIAELNLANHVNVLGHVPPAETPAVYRDHDVFVTASPMETQGLVVMEAMASGLPVIGVDRLAVPEFVRNGETGFVVPPGDAQAMGEAMLTLLRNPPEIRRLAPNARCEAEKMALPGAVDRNEEIYYGVLSRRD
ncbi:MAG: glycosyltransferase family 4 protein, partial [Myxococcales bacterium]|nr:glycosyltransferase family 4 protein [Myxococcales bacterium]